MKKILKHFLFYYCFRKMLKKKSVKNSLTVTNRKRERKVLRRCICLCLSSELRAEQSKNRTRIYLYLKRRRSALRTLKLML